MATLIVRRVDDRVVDALKERARRHGRSAEAEHRAILEAALADAAPTASELLAFLRAGAALGFAYLDLDRQDRGGPVEPVPLDDRE